ncbi:MAG: hypothetical protein MJZ30_09400 [Paludibacteraceae bacterium]|nr:hypothetical protein [Paludibacteraceae bacterium]
MYNTHNFKDGDVLHAQDLNEIEDGINNVDRKKVDFPDIVVNIQPTSVVEGKLIDKRLSESSNASYEYAILDVIEGEVYTINAFSTNSDFVGAFTLGDSTKVLLSGTAQKYIEQEITIPNGANKLYINTRIDQTSLLIRKTRKMTQEEFVKASKYASRNQLCAISSSNETRVYIHRYLKDKDFVFCFSRKAINNLPDFSSFGTLDNTKDEVSTNISALITKIVSGATDFLSPSIIYAENNADGDYPNFTSEHFTGGVHSHNGTTGSGGASARNVHFGISVDGEDVEIGSPIVGNTARIIITNRLQGANTAKADGSGREIMEQKFTITFDARETKANVKCEITALEDMRISLHYGLSMYTNDNSAPAYFIGCRADRGVSLFSSVVGTKKCGDKYCYGFKQILGDNVFEFGIDTTKDLGLQYANNSNSSCVQAPLKAYMNLVNKGDSTDDMLKLKEGDTVYWEGYYKVYPNK